MRYHDEDREVTELLRTYDRTVARLAELGVDLTLARVADDGRAVCDFEGVRYRIEVTNEDAGVTNISFRSDHPPKGLAHELYSFHGKLPCVARRA